MSTLNQFIGIASTICPSSATITGRTPTTSSTTFDTSAPLGSRPNLACGFLLCKTGGNTAWIVAPLCAEVSRSWYCRNDAVSNANICTGCVGNWFVPTYSQLLNPGCSCRNYWDCYSCYWYWSSTQYNTGCACAVRLNYTNNNRCNKNYQICIRAFRCVTY